jgi:sugar transferase (PEP-CTERM/EpsH1 system associated)
VTKPKLLFLTHRFPFPPDKGDKIRALNILEHMAQRFEVFLGCLEGDAEASANLEWATGRGYQVFCGRLGKLQRLPRTAWSMLNGAPLSTGYFYHAGLANWVSKVLAEQRPALVYAYSSAMAQYVPAKAAAGTRFIMDFVDVDSVKWRQYAASKHPSIAWLYALEAKRLLEHDRRIAMHADASLFVSDAELELFRSLAPETAGRLHAVSNGVDTVKFSPDAVHTPPPVQKPRIVFVGVMDYWPNVEAVQWFTKEVFPAVKSSVKDASFQIVGSKPSPAVRALADIPGVEVTGSVADVRPYLKAADVVVAPLRIARGIQNKVLEAMAMARPLVTTPDALEGISARHHEHVLVAASAPEFASAVTQCLTGDSAANLGLRAREFVVEHYSWSAKLKALDLLLDER